MRFKVIFRWSKRKIEEKFISIVQGFPCKSWWWLDTLHNKIYIKNEHPLSFPCESNVHLRLFVLLLSSKGLHAVAPGLPKRAPGRRGAAAQQVERPTGPRRQARAHRPPPSFFWRPRGHGCLAPRPGSGHQCCGPSITNNFSTFYYYPLAILSNSFCDDSEI